MATKRKLKADGTTGKVAVYIVDDTAIDDLPFTTPLSHLDKVEFHSDLDYLAVSSIQTGTLSLPTRTGTTPQTVRHNLITHGLGYQPMVLGCIVGFEGYNTPLLGTTPIFMTSDVPANHGIRLRSLQLGSDATYVYLHEYVMKADTGYTFPAIDIDWRVLITTRNLDLTTGNNNTVSHPSNLYISPSRVVFGQGKFDTNRSHLKKVSTGGFPVCIGPSVAMVQSGGIDPAINLRWSVNGQSRSSGTNGSGITVSNSVVIMDAI